jgi:hypothetical protein
MKTFNIEIPEGYEIDQEKSTFEKIVFKQIKKGLPKTWEELIRVKGYYVTSGSYPSNCNGVTEKTNKNVFATAEQAEAAIAMAQLSQLRDAYRQGWKPDWCTKDNKHCIVETESRLEVQYRYQYPKFLSFQSIEVAEEFLSNFCDLIRKARPLMS